MPFHTAVYIVCSPRPRVGRTLLSRMLVDFFLDGGGAVAAFDLNAEPELTQYLPEQASVSNITDIKGQMALFDRLITQDGMQKVVDIGPPALAGFLEVARETGFADEARRRGIAPVFLFLISPEQSSVDAYAALSRDFPDAILMPVHNEANGRAQHRDKFQPRGGAVLPVQLPSLPPGLRRIIEQKPFSFTASTGKFVLETPLDIQMQLQRWMRRAFVSFREMELRILLGDVQDKLQGALQDGSQRPAHEKLQEESKDNSDTKPPQART